MASHPEPRIPVIDVTSVRTRAIDGERAVVREIGDACRGIGFFYITGHGIAPETLARVFLLSRQFFTAPASLKNQARFSGPAANRGFISFGGETLDPGKPPDLKEAFNIGLELAAVGDLTIVAVESLKASREGAGYARRPPLPSEREGRNGRTRCGLRRGQECSHPDASPAPQRKRDPQLRHLGDGSWP